MLHPMMHATEPGVFHGQGAWTYRKDNKRAEAGMMNINNILGAAIGDPIKQQTQMNYLLRAARGYEKTPPPDLDEDKPLTLKERLMR